MKLLGATRASPGSSESINGAVPEDSELSLEDRLVMIASEYGLHEAKPGWLETKKVLPEHLPYFLMKVKGYAVREIADHYAVSPESVRATLRSYAGRALLQKLYAEIGIQADAGEIFLENAVNSANTLVELSESAENENVRLRAAFSILDRAGYGATKSVRHIREEAPKGGNVAASKLDRLLAALEESRSEPVDAEFEILTEVVEPSKDESSAA